MKRYSLVRAVHWFVCAVIALSIHAANANGGGDTIGAGGLNHQQLAAISASGSWLSNPVWSPDGRFLSFTSHDYKGLYLLDTTDQTCVKITDAAGSGYACNFSSDGRRLGFKLLIPASDGGFPLQLPVVFDVHARTITPLHAAVARCGVPSFAKDGTVAFTIDRELRLTDMVGNTLRTFKLDGYANLTPISPDGTRVVYNDHEDQLWLLDTATGHRTPLTQGESFFNPLWAPDSAKIVASTLAGRLKTIELATGQIIDLENGSSACWSSDSQRVLFCHTERIDGIKLVGSDVDDIRWDGKDRRRTLAQEGVSYVTSVRPSPDGRSLACAGPTIDGLIRVNLAQDRAADDTGSHRIESIQSLMNSKTAISSCAGINTLVESALATGTSRVATESLAQIRISGSAPYIHQVYDTPDWFDGGDACGATSAMMAISYYNTLPYWDTTCSWPYSHVSHYGRYICETYSFNGYTYNISLPDASGTPATGGFGYIVRNNWYDTKGYMRDYILNHGRGSEADFSTSWTKLQTEINNSTPFVLLCDLTTSGHYILTIGYFDTQRTAIFNDPYGNKNSGYMNYNGAGVYYDWPGYNNGYQNLNFAECFIYCRGSAPVGFIVESRAGGQNVSRYSEIGGWGDTTGKSTASGTTGGIGARYGSTYRSVAGEKHAIFSADLTVAGAYEVFATWAANANRRNPILHRITHANGTTDVNVDQSSQANAWVSLGTYSFSAGTNVGNVDVNNLNIDASGSMYADAVKWEYRGLPAPATITGQPANQSVCPGMIATFTVAASGAGPLTYQWKKNGTNLSDSGHYSGVSTATLTVSNVDANDLANYRCVITNLGGSVNSNQAAINLRTATTITQQPQSQAVNAGGTATFSVTATGDGTPAYSWSKDGQPLSDDGRIVGAATATLIINSVVPEDAGSYSVEVTGGCGDVSSQSATLTVNALPPPQVTAAVSRKTHGSAGDFDIDIMATNAVECRKNGPTQVLVTFDQPIRQISGTVNDVSLSSGTVSALAISGNQLTVAMSGAADTALLTMGFPGISNATGQAATGTLCFGVLSGDATGDKKVNVFDLQAVKGAVNQTVTALTFRHDVAVDGGINVFDLLAAKNNLNKTITASCP